MILGFSEPLTTWRLFILYIILIVCFWRNSLRWARAPSFTRFLDHTQQRTTVGRTPRTSDQLVAETSTWQHTTHRPQSQQASGRRPTP